MSVPLPHCRCLYVVRTRLSTVGDRTFPCCCCSYLEQSVPTCHVHTLHVCSPRSPQGYVPFHDFHRNICSDCTATVVIFRHFNPCFTYLLTHFQSASVMLCWQHDPETAECSPGGVDGNYIMYARATSGDRPNNNKFSSCSKKSMSQVLQFKARTHNGCFICECPAVPRSKA